VLVTKRAEYGIKAMVYLALNYQGAGPVPAKSIAATEGIPRVYLEQLFNRLKRKGLVMSARGPMGGYRLSERPEDTSILDIIEALDGRLSVRGGVSREECAGKSGSASEYAAGDMWEDVERDIRAFLGGISLRDLARKAAGRKGMLTV